MNIKNITDIASHGLSRYDAVIAGSGIAGATAARVLAERYGADVLVLESRDHIGGNAYDCTDEHGVLIHKYGPHIFHTSKNDVFAFLSRFTEWSDYRHTVRARIGEQYIPVPFNLTSLELTFGARAEAIEKLLLGRFGEGAKVSVAQLRDCSEPELRELAEYIYHNIYAYYTEKQWGKKPEDMPASVTGRVPIILSRTDGYFTDMYQGMPLRGYTEMFERMLDHPGITVCLGADARDFIRIENGMLADVTRGGNAVSYEGAYIYTGAIDALFDHKFGALPYRTLDFRSEYHDAEYFQCASVVNYTVSEKYTRITEFKRLTGQNCRGTSVVYEYPRACEREDIPYYPEQSEDADRSYAAYRAEAEKYADRLYLLGRLAEYKYLNMDDACARGLALAERIGPQLRSALRI